MPEPAREGPWTAYVCPECGSVCASRLTAEVHAATICDPDSWPWQPVQVISLATAERLAEALRPFIDEGALGSYEHGEWVPIEIEVWVTPEQMKEAGVALAAYHEATGSRATEGGTDGG